MLFRSVHLKAMLCKPLLHLLDGVGVFQGGKLLHLCGEFLPGTLINGDGLFHQHHVKLYAPVVDLLVEMVFLPQKIDVYKRQDYGVPQKRERVFFIGIRGDSFDEKRLHQLITHHKTKAAPIRDILLPLGKAGSEENPRTCVAKINFCARPVMRKSPYAGMYFNGQGRPIDIDGYANTLPASMGGNKTPFIDEDYLYGEADDNFIENYHKGLMDGSIIPEYKEAPSRLRRITIREAAKIQTFPDDYIFCGKPAAIYKQIGNAVPCKMAEAVASAVAEYLQA